jgi:hypothetical protein
LHKPATSRLFNALVVQIQHDAQIQLALLGLDLRDARDPLGFRLRFSQKFPLLLHSRQLALESSQRFVPWRPGAAESGRSRMLCLALPAGQQGVANSQRPGHPGAADAGLARLLNRTALEFGPELPAL